MQILKADSPEAEAALRAIETRRNASEEEALRVADDAIEGVRVGGDTFVRRQIARFDGVAIQDVLIAPRDVNIDPQMAEAIDMAIARVEAFHRQQLPVGYTWSN